MKIDLEWFKAMVDASLPPDIDGVLDHDALVGRIQALIAESGNIDVHDVRALSTHLFLLAEVEGQDNRKYVTIADTLSDCLPNGKALTSPTSTGTWASALEAAIKLSKVRPESEESFSLKHAALNELAAQAKKMINYGVPVKVVEAQIATDDTEIEKFCLQLDEDIRRYGGIELADQIFRRIAGVYDNIQERYHLCRRPRMVPPAPSAELPIGYLLNLAVKHTEISVIALPNPDVFLASIEDHATALMACLNVQPYNSFELMFADARSLPRLLQRIAIYDANFTLFQLRPKDSPRILRRTLDWVDPDRLKELLGYTPAEAAMATELILTMAQERIGAFIFTRKALEHCGIQDTAVNSILRDLTHKSRPNTDFRFPTQWLQVDFWLRPLVKRGGSYVLVNPSWCAPAFYEAFIGAIRNCGYPADVGSEIGKATERLIQQEIESRAVTVRSGTYNMSGQVGECDAFVETEKDIVFIELKAKPLTRMSREGNEAQLLIDLISSLLVAQTQLGQHEKLLLQHGYLDLQQPDGTPYRLELRERQIERVATTLLDFGGFQDRVILHNIMNVLTTTRYAPVNKNLDAQFKKLKSSCEKLAAQTSELTRFSDQQKSNPFFSCWFLSVPQILIMMDDVRDANSFVSSLWTTRHLTMSTLDFYFEYAQAKRIRGKTRP